MSAVLEQENVASWIDLAFGINQRGHRAQSVMNLYQSSVYCDQDLNEMPKHQKESYMSRLRWFGVCPPVLFQDVHPTRFSQTPANQDDQL